MRKSSKETKILFWFHSLKRFVALRIKTGNSLDLYYNKKDTTKTEFHKIVKRRQR